MPRFGLGSAANRRASSITPAVPEALSSAPGMDRPGQRRRHRELLAQPQVIVMRADHDVLGRLARQVSGHVVYGLDHALHVHVLGDRNESGQREGARLQVLVDVRFKVVQILACALRSSARPLPP